MLTSPRFRNLTRHSSVRLTLLLLPAVALLVLSYVSSAQLQSSDFATSGEGPAKAEFVPGHVLVRFRSDSAMKAASASKSAMLSMQADDGRSIVASVERFGGSELVEGLRLARVPAEDTLRAVESFSARPDVEFAEPDYIWRKSTTPNDPNFGSLY